MKILKRLFCKHKYDIPAGYYYVPINEKTSRVRHTWKCSKCGKIKY